MDRKQRSQVLTGVVMMTLGLIFLAERMDIWPGLDLGRLWPLLPIAIGLGRMALPGEEGRRSGRFDGVWLVFVGALFLLHNGHIMTLGQSWPLFIVAGGIAILFGKCRERNTLSPEGKP